jgi:diguanylate cyclase (GGDEF)-like protein
LADQASGDHPADSTNGASEGQQQRSASSAADQTSAVSDQASSERDRRAADQAQAASDRDLGAGVDPRAHEASQEIRERGARQRECSALDRELTARMRLDAASMRDEAAHCRDLGAMARDHAADVRDLAMTQLDANDDEFAAKALTGVNTIAHAAWRKIAAQQRTRAGQQRVLAAHDRQTAAEDRRQSSDERQRALADREMLARQLQIAEIDVLTGTSTRASGLTNLNHELDRCRRAAGHLVIAYVDVIGLKTLNDSVGHSAGDKLLQHVVALIKKHLRSYDLIIRMGGDEFVCAVSNITLSDTRRRFSAINNALAETPGPGAIRSGFAELLPDETAEHLIARADDELVAHRRDHDRRPPTTPLPTSLNSDLA